MKKRSGLCGWMQRERERKQVLGTEFNFKHGRDIEVAWARKESKGYGWHAYVTAHVAVDVTFLFGSENE